MGAKSQFNRVAYILEALQSQRYLTAAAIAREYEVSERTIRRDIEWLRDFHNAPIDFDRRKHGYVLTDPTYRLPTLTLSEGELIAITVGEQVLASYRNSPWHGAVQRAFTRIESLLPETVTLSAQLFSQRVSVITPPVSAIDPAVWDGVLQATRTNRVMEIGYRSGGYRRTETRRVQPYRLVAHEGAWYIIGYSSHHGQVRVFSLSRLRSVRVCEERFTIPDDFDPATYIDPEFGVYNRVDAGPQEVRIRFDAAVAHVVSERRWHSSQSITALPDGGIELRFVTNQTDQVLYRVMAYGPAAEIVAPEALRRRAGDWAQRLAQRYCAGSR